LTNNNDCPDVIFIGQPNSGKSTLFNAVAGLKAVTSNFPGTTVKHSHSRVNVAGRELNIIDLPGTYSLNPSDEAEKVALSHLFLEKPDLVVNVLDASILGRSLEMTLELIELECPMIVALNMVDLAEKKGIDIDPQKLERLLGVPVIPTIASRGRGIKELLEAAFKTLEEKRSASHLKWAKDVEDKVNEVEKLIPEDFLIVANKRFSAVKIIEIDRPFFNRMLEEISAPLKEAVDKVRADLESRHNAPAYEVIASERHHLALKIFEESSTVKRGSKRGWQERVDDFIMHPFLGYIFLLVVFLGFFVIIFTVANPIEEALLGPLSAVREQMSNLLGSGVIFYLLDGLVQGIGGGIVIVLPYFIPLLFLMSLLEDVGYLARVGFLMDIFMHKIGLHGKSVSSFILGFGCNVPAIISTRILESRRDRVITSLLIPFIPCSARTTIVLALVAYYMGPIWAFGFYVSNMILVGIIGRILSWFYKIPSPGLILEIPTLKVPSLKNIFLKTYFQLKSFVKFAWPILIAGSVVLGVMQFFNFDKVVNLVLSPVVNTLLGLPEDLGVTLIFGFLRKELSLIMMLQALGTGYQGLMSVITRQQLIVFTVFVSLFIPCLSTVAILWKEIGRKEALLSMALNSSVALLVAFLVRLILRA
jgi:ferrous iron transport protein B